MRVLLECPDSSAVASWAKLLTDAGVEVRPSASEVAAATQGDILILVIPPASTPEPAALLHSIREKLADGVPILIASSAGALVRTGEYVEAGVCGFLTDNMQTEEIRIRLRVACGAPGGAAGPIQVKAKTALALSLTHDYNNILSAIQGNVDLSLMSPAVPQDLRYNLEQIGKSVSRAAGLTRQIIESLRPEPSTYSTLDIVETLRRLAPFVQDLAGNRKVAFNLPRETARVALSFLDLVTLLTGYFMSADSEGKDGEVSITVSLHEPAEAVLELSESGLPATEVFRKSLQIVKPDSSSSASSESGCTGGTILLVDDEDAIRTAAQRILRREGYTVLEASSGEEGLELFRTIGGILDAVILDLHMPGMEGGEVLHHMRDLRPEVRVVVWSGFPEEVARRQMNGFSDVTFLEKPTQLGEFPVMLARALRTQQT